MKCDLETEQSKFHMEVLIIGHLLDIVLSFYLKNSHPEKDVRKSSDLSLLSSFFLEKNAQPIGSIYYK